MVFQIRNTGRPFVEWQDIYVYLFSGFYYSEILAFLFIIHGISLVKSCSIPSWLANRKMSELQHQPVKLNAGQRWLNQTETKFHGKVLSCTKEAKNSDSRGRSLRHIFTTQGLDAAGPLFWHNKPGNRFDPGNADFVDAIHTDSDKAGISRLVGHIDFYPNGGKDQPQWQPRPSKPYGAVLMCDYSVQQEFDHANWAFRLLVFFRQKTATVHTKKKFPSSKRRKSKCFGRESVLYSGTNWQQREG